MAGVLTVVARIHPKAGRENEVEGLLVKMAAAVRQHEPDCLVYRPHRSVAGGGEPTVFYFYEQTARTPRSSSIGPRRISPGTGPR